MAIAQAAGTAAAMAVERRFSPRRLDPRDLRRILAQRSAFV
jgi:hypothetical protein